MAPKSTPTKKQPKTYHEHIIRTLRDTADMVEKSTKKKAKKRG